MRTYTWDEYYEKFYDWAESTQIRNLSALTSLGDADEVAEVIIELQGNVSASNRLLKKAVAAKLAFSASDLIEFLCGVNDTTLATAALYNSASRLTAEDMEDLYGEVDDEVIIEICTQRKLALPEALREEDAGFEEANDELGYEKAEKPSFFTALLALFGSSDLPTQTNRRQKRSAKCNGDCANCPPHYGYRYGRWYYGKGHAHGCEFGGNKGDGSL